MGRKKRLKALIITAVFGIAATGITADAGERQLSVKSDESVEITAQMQSAGENVVYVSLDGRKNAAGTIEDPFASIEEARDYLRTKKLSVSNRGTVYIREGVYHVAADNPTINLDSEDSYVTYSAYQDEEVKLSGTITLAEEKFKKLNEVTGEAFSSQSRLPESVKNKVFVYDLGAEAIPAGTINKNGFNWPKQPFQPELVVDGSLQTLARYPNNGVMTSTEILAGKTKDGTNEDQTAKAAGANEGGRPRNYFFDKTDSPKTYEQMLAMGGPVFYTRNGLETRIAAWGAPTQAGEPQVSQPDVHPDADNTLYETDGWLSGYFENNYANDMVRIYSVDTAKQVIHCKYPSLQGVQDKRIMLTAINLLCELDQEGEYYIDRFMDNDVLYYYPENGDIAGKEIALTSSSQPFFALEGAAGIIIRGIEMSGGTGYGITLMDCESCIITDCEFANFSLDAVKIGQNNNTITTDPSYTTSRGGHNNVVRNCTIHDIGCGGVYLSGGDEQTLEPGNNLVEHCEFYNISRLQTYTPAVYLEGAGNIAQYNYIHDAPHMVIQIMGNDMLVAHNYIENVCSNTSDQGAIYCGRSFNWLGNVISDNYFKGIISGNYAVYMDDGMSGIIIKDNIFENVSGSAIFSNCGFGHQITDNIMVKVATGIKYQAFSGSRPVANEKVLSYRYDKVLRPGDGTNYTNTQENIDNWYSHYTVLYPYLSSRFYAEESDETWMKNSNSVFVPNNQILKRTVTVGTKSLMGVGNVASLQDSKFNTQNYYADTVSALGLDLTTGKFSTESPLKDIEGYGTTWIKKWNAEYTLENIGPLESAIGDVNQNGKIDVNDALLILRHTAQIAVLSGNSLTAADVDGDAKITPNDALGILQFLVGKIQDFSEYAYN